MTYPPPPQPGSSPPGWQPYPPPHHYAPYPYYPPPGPGLNTMALASAVTGGMGLLTVMFVPITSVLAIVFGHKALREISRTGESGRQLAVVGLWIGYVSLVVLVLGVAAIVIAVAAS